MSDYSELVSRLYSADQSFGETDLGGLYLVAADAIADLQARLRLSERRCEDAEARNVFLETEIAALAEKVKK